MNASPLADLSTPTLLLDVPRMQGNISRMQSRMDAMKVRLRPHVKTSKCLPVIQRQIAAGASGITVSTLKEAEHCFEAGIDNILYAVAIAPGKLGQALALVEKGCQLGILTDSVQGAEAIVEFARAHGACFDVWIEVDSDGHRSGLKSTDPALVEIASLLHLNGMRLSGVLTHAGSSYELDEPAALRRLAEQERFECVRAAEHIRNAGLPCPEVSVGSTPTALSASMLDGVTEVRAGVYVFFDLVMLNVGVCKPEELALSVLTTVIGHQVDKGWIITDAGWMAMSRDRGTQRQRQDFAFGQVCTISGTWIEGALMQSANQEHGIIMIEGVEGEELQRRFPVGHRLRIAPNHACATGAQFDHYTALDEHGDVQTWSRLHGW